MVESIIKSFDIWTDAQGLKSKGRVKSIDNISLEGIAHLRELILELAIRGKLVPQEPNEESASGLLKKVEKEKLVQEGKIKKEKALYEIKDEEKPFGLPSGWEWTVLNNISVINGGFAFKSSNYSNDGYRVIRISDFDENGLKEQDIVRHAFNEDLEPFLLKENNILMAMTGGTVGKSLLVKEVKEPMIVNQRVATINIVKPINEEYIKCVIQTRLIKDVIVEAKNSTNDNISMGDIRGFLIPLPSRAEQDRIVAKVEELMALCDELEREKTANLKTHQSLVAALLQTLTAAKNAGEVERAWYRLVPHFDTLFCTEDSIEQLKQTILQLAVMGRLVKQDPNHEPASELLKKIEKEKEKLIKEGKIKKDKPLPEIEDGEKPFALPSGWEFVRLSDLCALITKGSSPKWQGVSYVDNENEVLFITSENVGSFKMLLENRKYVENKFNEMEPRSILKRGDFLMNIVGGSIGRTAVFDLPDLANINQAVCLIRAFIKFLDYKYLLYFFNSEICISYMFDKQVDNARANLSMGNISKFVIPVPPIDEQRKIVAKVEELIALCDSLNEKVLKSQEIQNILSKTIVESAVA